MIPPRRAFPRAFTLVEVLLVLALLALIVSIMLPAGGALLRDARETSFEGTVLAAVQDARREAVLTGREVELRHETATRTLVWSDGRRTRQVPLPGPAAAVEFLRPRGGAVLLGGRLVETDPVARLRFYPDGTCDAVRLQLRPAGADPRVIPLDPWTCTPVPGPAT